MTNNINDKSAEEKANYVNSKVAYWPKSLVARFAELENRNDKMFQILMKLSDNQKIDISDIIEDK